MSVIIGGGGFSGVETAGELVDFLYASLKYYKRISREDLRITLLHSGERLLQELSPSLGRFTLRKMMDRGVDVRLNARAVRVTDRDVHLESGELISGGTVICTIGTQPNALLDSIPGMKSRGRLVVQPDMSGPGLEGVSAGGDGAAVINVGARRARPPTERVRSSLRLASPSSVTPPLSVAARYRTPCLIRARRQDRTPDRENFGSRAL